MPPPPTQRGVIGRAFDSVSGSAASKLMDRRNDKTAKDFEKAMDSLLKVPGGEGSGLKMVDFAAGIEESSAEAFGWRGKIPGLSDKKQIEAMKRSIDVAKGVGRVLEEVYGSDADQIAVLTDRKPIPLEVRLQCRLSCDPAATVVELDDAIENYLRTAMARDWMMWREGNGMPKPRDQQEMNLMMEEDRNKKVGGWKFNKQLMRYMPSSRKAARSRIKQRKGWVKQTLP